MSKKPDTASALAGILKARRGDQDIAETVATASLPSEPERQPPPSPALLPPVVEKPQVVSVKLRNGKSSDKAIYSQFSVYLRKDTRKKVGRALDDEDTGQDFSDLVQELLEQWLASRT
jgi:hypothetical protein